MVSGAVTFQICILEGAKFKSQTQYPLSRHLVFRHFLPCVQDNAGTVIRNMHGSCESLVIIGSPLRTKLLTPNLRLSRSHAHITQIFKILHSHNCSVKGSSSLGFHGLLIGSCQLFTSLHGITSHNNYILRNETYN
jgi:hypothetical protein